MSTLVLTDFNTFCLHTDEIRTAWQVLMEELPMVGFCQEVVTEIRSVQEEAILDRLIRESIVRFMHTRNTQHGSRYIINMIAFLHTAAVDATHDKYQIELAIELFKEYLLRDPESLLLRNELPGAEDA